MLIKISKKEIIKLIGKKISVIFIDYYDVPLNIYAYELSIEMINHNVVIKWEDNLIYWDYPFKEIKVKINHNRYISFSLKREKLFIEN